MGLGVLPTSAFAQMWVNECIDPMNTAPYTTDYAISGIGNQFMAITQGLSGTVTYGGMSGPCYAPTARTLSSQGRFSFFTNGQGSSQSAFDDVLAYTVGAPRDPVGDFCYARVVRFDPTEPPADAEKSFLFGEDGIGHFVGSSNRYFISLTENGGCRVELRADAVGDAIRMRWRLTNTGTTIQTFGLKFGAWPGMFAQPGSYVDPVTGDFQPWTIAGSNLGTATGVNKVGTGNPGYPSYIMTGENRPIREGRSWLRSTPGFPTSVTFAFGQALPYGMRIENESNDSVPDHSPVAGFVMDDEFFLTRDNTMESRVFNDPNYGSANGDPVLNNGAPALRERSDVAVANMAFVQTFQTQNVGPGNTIDIVNYVRSSWSVASYATNAGTQPSAYSAVLDGPLLIGLNPNDSQLAPNPFQVFAHVDNTLAELDQEISLTNVKVTITLPEGQGVTLAPGESITKVIPLIAPKGIESVQWDLVTDGTSPAEVPYTVTFQPTPGPKKVLSGKFKIASSPKVRLGEGANMISFPWSFNDTSLDAVFAPLVNGVDFYAYRWNPDTGEYVPVTSAERGQAIWIVSDTDTGILDLIGAQPAPDNVTGGLVTNLRPGWNQIGNPYSYPIPLSQLVGFAEDNPSRSLTWAEMVQNQLVSPSLAFWQRDPADPTSGSYAFTSSNADTLLPNQGYWVYVTSFQPVRLSWPPVFTAGLPGSTRSQAAANAWTQSDKQWRLNLVARNEKGVDSGNYVGVAKSKAEATRLRVYEPPRSPNSAVELSVLDTVDGKPARLAQALSEQSGRREFKVNVRSNAEGEVTLLWPNVNSIPRNVRVQLVDAATNTTRDLRFASSYSFRMEANATREMKLQIEPGLATKAVIGNVIVTRPSKDVRSPFTINYSLSSSANTTIRVLGSNGSEVYTVTRGRADRVGENSATWTMRDNANRAVAPGVYQVEIVAETSTGERVRKLVPVNVVR